MADSGDRRSLGPFANTERVWPAQWLNNSPSLESRGRGNAMNYAGVSIFRDSEPWVETAGLSRPSAAAARRSLSVACLIRFFQPRWWHLCGIGDSPQRGDVVFWIINHHIVALS